MRTESSLRTIAFLGDYLPRKCGIATFTSDLLRAVAARHPQSRCFAVPVNDINGCYQYPDVVRFEIEEQNLNTYRRAADFLNSSSVDVVSVQHEFGIFGGPAGSHLLALLRALRAPVVSHLYRMTDSTGVFQHATLTAPSLSQGYCTDDNARALIVAVLLGQGSEDCHGRAIWALGTPVGRSPHWSSQMMAEQLFAQALPAATAFTSPRAWAFSLIGIDEYLRQRKSDRLAEEVREELTTRLMTVFDTVAATGRKSVYKRGIQALRWLVGVQTSPYGQLRPIGSNLFYLRNGVRAVHAMRRIYITRCRCPAT